MHETKACPYKKEKELLVGLFPEKLIKILISQKQLVSAIREFPLEVQDGIVIFTGTGLLRGSRYLTGKFSNHGVKAL